MADTTMNALVHSPARSTTTMERGPTLTNIVKGLSFGFLAWHRYNIAIRNGTSPAVAARQALDMD